MCGSANNAESAVRALFPLAAVVACLLLVSPGGTAQTRAWTEPLLIERLNQTADHFKSLTANLLYTKFTQVVDDKSTESGRLTSPLFSYITLRLYRASVNDESSVSAFSYSLRARA